MTDPLLKLERVNAGYGASRVLFDVSFELHAGQVMTLLGRNGMGKTTTLKSIVGLLRIQSGSILFDNREMSSLEPYDIARQGIAIVPEGRRIFPNLSVRENLLVGEANRHGMQDPWHLEKVLQFFPSIARRIDNSGAKLSGGEQQMLAIGRALMTNPHLLILDEATEGLAPLVRQEIWDCLAELKRIGTSMIVVDKDIDALSALADHHVILEKGVAVWSGSNAELQRDEAARNRYLSI